MPKTLETTNYDTSSPLTDDLETAREDFIAYNAPDKGPLELEEERKAQHEKEVETSRNLALAAFTETNLSFNGYTENID